MLSTKRKAFTLVELMVAMAIIAVLLGLATFGISTLNRLSRDNQRRTTVDNIQRMVSAYYADYFRYPNTAELTVTSTSIGINNYNFPAVPLNSVLAPNANTSLSGTRYCYSFQSDGYVLAAKLESGQYFNVGESATKCSDTTTSLYLAP
jgi:prepilin-type N-terminal cleavage/methylation domain-containing protein